MTSKTFTKDLSSVLTALFQESLNQGTVPKDWTKANIISIYKKGDKSSPDYLTRAPDVSML